MKSCSRPVPIQKLANGEQPAGLVVVAQRQTFPRVLKGPARPVVTQVRQTPPAQRGVLLGKLTQEPEIGLAAPAHVRPDLTGAARRATHDRGVHEFRHPVRHR